MRASLVLLGRKLDNAPRSLKHASQFFVNREISSFKVGSHSQIENSNPSIFFPNLPPLTPTCNESTHPTCKFFRVRPPNSILHSYNLRKLPHTHTLKFQNGHLNQKLHNGTPHPKLDLDLESHLSLQKTPPPPCLTQGG
jgi:hypothetical protein